MRRLLLLPFLALTLGAAEPVVIPPIKFTQRTLPNGLKVYAAADRSTPTMAINVWYHVGSKDDPTGRSGFALRSVLRRIQTAQKTDHRCALSFALEVERVR